MWTLEIVAEMLGVHVTVAGDYCRTGELQSERRRPSSGGREQYLVSPEAVIRLAENRCAAETAKAEEEYSERLRRIDAKASRMARGSTVAPWKQLLNVGQASRVLGTHPDAIYRAIEQGILHEQPDDWTVTLLDLRSYIDHVHDAKVRHWRSWCAWIEQRVEAKVTFFEAMGIR